jgi:capsid portal protein
MRGCFRIPAAILAFSEDHTRATVVEATRVAEEQVFIPERRPFDYMINTKILADMRIQYLDYRSLGAKTSDHSAIVRSMAAVKDALPVGVIQEAVADLRNTPVGEIPAELYEMTLGEMLVGEIPAELYEMTLGEMLRMSAGGEFEEGKPTEETVKKLLTIKKAFEKRIAEHEKNQ